MKIFSFAYSRITKICGISLVLLMTSQSGHAFDLKINKTDANHIVSNLSYDKLIKKIPNLIEFQEKDIVYILTTMQDKYLTFYSTKNENIEATYKNGAYYLNYTARW